MTRRSQTPSITSVRAWRRSSRSSSGGNVNCVEAGSCHHHEIAIRDSKSPDSGVLTIDHRGWTDLLYGIKSDRLS